MERKIVFDKHHIDTSVHRFSEEEISNLMNEAKSKLPKQVSRFSKSMGIDFEKVFIKAQKTRWGSCSDRGNISLNCLLMVVPSYVRKYVIIHELAHIKAMNHSTEFWKIVSEEMPNYKDAIRWLKKNGSKIINRLEV